MALIALAALWLPACAETPAPPPATIADQPAVAGSAFTADEIADLIAPIALYPDDLLAIVLPASTYPLQIVEAQRFLDAVAKNPSLKPEEGWDDSVVALLNYPEVVKLMSDDLDWLQRLGEAVLGQQSEVIAAIEGFRKRAYTAGNLKSDDRQVVEVEDDAIRIRPADPKVIYVPYYEPAAMTVYHRVPSYYYYPRPYPVYYYPYPADYMFASGFFWGVTTFYTLGWHTHHVHVYDYDYHDHPFHGRPYHYNRYYYRRPPRVVNNYYIDRDEPRRHDYEDDRARDDRQAADAPGGYPPKRRHEGEPRQQTGTYWQPDYRRTGARPGTDPRRAARGRNEPRHVPASRTPQGEQPASTQPQPGTAVPAPANEPSMSAGSPQAVGQPAVPDAPVSPERPPEPRPESAPDSGSRPEQPVRQYGGPDQARPQPATPDRVRPAPGMEGYRRHEPTRQMEHGQSREGSLQRRMEAQGRGEPTQAPPVIRDPAVSRPEMSRPERRQPEARRAQPQMREPEPSRPLYTEPQRNERPEPVREPTRMDPRPDDAPRGYRSDRGFSQPERNSPQPDRRYPRPEQQRFDPRGAERPDGRASHGGRAEHGGESRNGNEPSRDDTGPEVGEVFVGSEANGGSINP